MRRALPDPLAVTMRYLVFLATIFVTLVCPFVCGRSCGGSSKTATVQHQKSCCGHCQRRQQDSQSPAERRGPCDRQECCCPCLCNGAILVEPVDVPAVADSVFFGLPPQVVVLQGVVEPSVEAPDRDQLRSSLSGHDRRVTFCSFTC